MTDPGTGGQQALSAGPAVETAARSPGLKQTLLSEFDDEIAMTRQLLDRLPDGALSWRPHDRSMSLGELAAHLGQILHWSVAILEGTAHDLAHDHAARPADDPSRAAVLERFDRSAAEIRRALVGSSDAQLAAPWALRRSGELVMSLPRGSAVRRFLLNHLVHHRGQLTVYLRMHDVTIPPLYGPTADERM